MMWNDAACRQTQTSVHFSSQRSRVYFNSIQGNEAHLVLHAHFTSEKIVSLESYNARAEVSLINHWNVFRDSVPYHHTILYLSLIQFTSEENS
mmetsp:Transcript_24417/g.51177  ORF Transcript_24417/g.51177 Transcript_24417/m.51177 type:complete len:93 (+) Transcript_24417:57-335(+)